MMELGWQKLELGKRETNMWYLKTQAPVTLVTCLLSVIARICFETRRSDWSVPIPIACSSGTHLTWQTTPPLWAEDDALYQSSGWIGMEGPRSADFWPPSRGPEVSRGPYRSRGPNAPVAGSMKSHQRLEKRCPWNPWRIRGVAVASNDLVGRQHLKKGISEERFL